MKKIVSLLALAAFCSAAAWGAPQSSDKKDHLRLDVSGDVNGDTLTVTSIKLL